MRLFVAIDLDEGARQAIGAEQQRLAKALGADQSPTWVQPTRMHVTLAFFGDIGDAKAREVIDAMSPDLDVSPFAAVFDRFGVFPARGRPRVLWLGVGEGAREMAEVQRRVTDRLDRLDVALEPRPFHPHLTLARWRTSRPADGQRALSADRHADVARVIVDHVTLYHSRLTSAGSTYAALSRATLT